MKKMFLAIEVNLLLWIALAGVLWSETGSDSSIKTLALVGAGFAALFQHWAYYSIRDSKLRGKAKESSAC